MSLGKPGVDCPPRRAGAILLAGAWNLPACVLASAIAVRCGWWSFSGTTPYMGIPVLFFASRPVLWGAIPAMIPRNWVVVPVSILDLLLAPFFFAGLDSPWFLGEILCLLVCFLPAQLFAIWTIRNCNLIGRLILHFLYYSALLLWLIPSVILGITGGSWQAFAARSAPWNQIYLQLLAVPAVMILAAVRDFFHEGLGTPMPYDPPKRLVTSGIYGYLANPMQVGKILLLAGWGAILGSPPVMGFACLMLVYSRWIANPQEERAMLLRFGDKWINYRSEVGRWWPRWKPLKQPRGAKLYLDIDCGPCSELARWFAARNPIGLAIVSARLHPTRILTRPAYDPCNGGKEAEGVAAFACALEHLNFGWAFSGWVMRLPVLQQFLQLTTDAVTASPEVEQRTGRLEILHKASSQTVHRLSQGRECS